VRNWHRWIVDEEGAGEGRPEGSDLFPELHLLAAKVRDIGLHEIDVSEQPEIGIHAGSYFFSATELDSS